MPRNEDTAETHAEWAPDPGWLFLLAGIALLAAIVLVSAADDLAETRYARDTALVLRDLHAERLARHEAYLAAIDDANPAVIEQLTVTQLNALTPGKKSLPGTAIPVSRTASVFGELEPPARPAPRRDRVGSALERWATGDGRIWMIGAGGLLLLLGVLPASRSRA